MKTKTTYGNIWDVVKVVLMGRFIAINTLKDKKDHQQPSFAT